MEKKIAWIFGVLLFGSLLMATGKEVSAWLGAGEYEQHKAQIDDWFANVDSAKGHFSGGDTLGVDTIEATHAEFTFPPLETSYYRGSTQALGPGYTTITWDVTEFENSDITLGSDNQTFTLPSFSEKRIYMMCFAGVDQSGTDTLHARVYVDGSSSAPFFESLATAQAASGCFPIYVEGNSSFVVQAGNAGSHNMLTRFWFFRIA